jgi:hypothetical protein
MSSDTGDGWCVDCGDFFHLDDCGGYNPPCGVCGLCRDCCRCPFRGRGDEAEDDGVDDGDYIAERVAERDDSPPDPYG